MGTIGGNELAAPAAVGGTALAGWAGAPGWIVGCSLVICVVGEIARRMMEVWFQRRARDQVHEERMTALRRTRDADRVLSALKGELIP